MNLSNTLMLIGATLMGAGLCYGFRPFGQATAYPSSKQPSTEAVSTDSARSIRPEDFHALVVEVRSMRQELVALKMDMLRRPEVTEVATVPSAPAIAAGGEQSDEEWAKHRQTAMGDLQAEFFTEPRDAAWSTESTSTIRSAIGDTARMKEALRAIDCRSTTCRVELAGESSSFFEGDLVPFARQLSTRLPNIVFDYASDAQGQKLVVLYLTADRDT